MIKILKTVILFAIVLTFQGCWLYDDDFNFNDKCTSECTVIKGRFITEDIQLPIEDVALKLTWMPNCGMSSCWFSSDRPIASRITDASGNFAFKFHARESELNNGFFVVSFTIPDNSYVNNTSSFSIEDIMKRDTVIVYDYLLPQKGQIELILKNPTDVASDDRLVCQVFYEYGNRTRTEWGGPLVSGETPDTVLCEAAGNQTNYVRIFKRKAGQETVTIDTIYVQKHLTYSYEIQF